MGSNRYTFIGAYLVFTKLPTEIKPETKVTTTITCDNAACEKYNKLIITSKFCPECGHPSKADIQKTTKDITKTTSVYKLMEEFGDDNILFNQENVLLPNHTLKNSITLEDDDESGCMNCPIKEDAIKEFCEKYKDFLKFLDTYPKTIQYEIHFGIVNYWH